VVKRERLVIRGLDGKTLVNVGILQLKSAWKRPFGSLI
jgi:hypothetical protein